MDTVRMVVASACFIGIAISIADMIKPSEKFNKQIKMIFSLIIILTIVAPFLTNSISLSISDSDVEAGNMLDNQFNSTIDDYIKKETEENLQNTILRKLALSGINCYDIQVSINIEEDTGISINRIQIDSDNNEYSKEIISSMLSIDKECINEIENKME